MRSIPFKIVCLLGMNDGVFPRKTRRPSWDFIAQSPRKGDRSLEKEDRYIFLEALLCARSVFYLSFVGRDIKDNSPHQPSVAVMELMELLDKTFFIQPEAPPQDAPPSISGDRAPMPSSRIFFQHRLQAFSPFYFAKSSPFASFSKENFFAAQSIMDSRPAFRRFFPEALPDPPPEWHNVTVQDICDFFSHPMRYLLKKRLGISLSDSRIDLKETESFSIEGLDGYAVGQLLLEKLIRGESKESCREYLKAKGMLPHGNAGLCAFARLADEVSDFVHTLATLRTKAHSHNIPVNGMFGDFSISGSIVDFCPPFVCRYRFGRKRPRDIITLWINTLALTALLPEVSCEGGIFAGRDGIWEIRGIENAPSLLKDALDFYWRGLSRPLPFFPLTSWTFAEGMLTKKSSSDAALRDALKIWIGNDYEQGEIKDEYLSLCYGNDPEEPLCDEFRATAVRILSPLFEYIRQRE